MLHWQTSHQKEHYGIWTNSFKRDLEEQSKVTVWMFTWELLSSVKDSTEQALNWVSGAWFQPWRDDGSGGDNEELHREGRREEEPARSTEAVVEQDTVPLHLCKPLLRAILNSLTLFNPTSPSMNNMGMNQIHLNPLPFFFFFSNQSNTVLCETIFCIWSFTRQRLNLWFQTY